MHFHKYYISDYKNIKHYKYAHAVSERHISGI